MTASDNIGQYSIAEDSNGDLVFVHPNNGSILKYNQNTDRIEPLKDVDANGNDVNNISGLQADDLSGEGVVLRDGWVVVDDTGYADIGAAFNDARNQHPDRRSFAIVPGDYTTDTTLNWTTFSDADVFMPGVTITGTGNCQNGIVVDKTDTRGLSVYGGIIAGDNANPPDIGVFNAREDAAGDANSGNLKAFNWDIEGTFNLAGFYNYGGEEYSFAGCYIGNTAADGYYVTAHNILGRESVYKTTATGFQSTNGHYWNEGSRIIIGANDSSSACVHMEGAADSVKLPEFIGSDGIANVYVDTGPAAPELLIADGVRFHPGLSGNTAQHNIMLDGGGSVRGLCVENCQFRASSAVVEANTVSVIGLTHRGNVPYGGDAPSYYILDNSDVVQARTLNYSDTTLSATTIRRATTLVGQDVSVTNTPSSGSWYRSESLGPGVVVPTPDSSARYRLYVANDGTVTATAV